MSIDANRLQQLLTQGESDELEFKVDVPPPRALAALICAFANTRGGLLVVGVAEPPRVVGVRDVQRALAFIREAAAKVSPSIEVEPSVVQVASRDVIVVRIPKGSTAPYLVQGLAFQRIGEHVVPLTAERLYENLMERATSVDDLRAEIGRLSSVLEAQNKQAIAERSWKSKASDMIVSGIVGALISLLLSRALRF